MTCDWTGFGFAVLAPTGSDSKAQGNAVKDFVAEGLEFSSRSDSLTVARRFNAGFATRNDNRVA